MKLEKFTKNKKQKGIVIGSIVGILLLIGGISIYRTFAMYKVEKTFDVLNGTVPFFCKENLNGAEPVLNDKLIPVTINDKGSVTRVSENSNDWYNYCNKQWANAVILVENAKDYKDGETIQENDIESYFVWIPKYKYKIFDMGHYKEITSSIDEHKNEKAIVIRFGTENTTNTDTSCATPGVSEEDGNCTVDKWMTHPAFTAFEGSKGFWVGKFETGYKGAQNKTNAQVNEYDISKVIIKPNQYSWRSITAYNAYENSFNYKRNLDSHMMKNIEWGAIAYLTQSIYGRCLDYTTCSAMNINGNDNYKTGYMNSNIDYFNNSVGASTTGNYSGVYDMYGGAWEQMMSVMLDETGKPMYKSGSNDSGFNEENFPKEQKYYDLYNYYIDSTHWNRRILGDATGELGPFLKDNICIIFSSFNVSFVNSTYGWFVRGGPYNYGSIFYSGVTPGVRDERGTFRIVLAP